MDGLFIILTQEQKEGFDKTRNLFSNYLNSKRIDVIPFLLKNDKWALPADLLAKDDFKVIYEHLNSINALDNLDIRHIDQSEFIEYNVI